MSTDRWLRASDQDREGVADVLREAYAVGRLNREEFDERCVAAYTARTCGELCDLTADLPVPPARTSLPSPALLPPDTALRTRARRWARGQMIRSLALVLVAGLAGRAFPATVWVVAVLIWLALVLPFTARGLSAPRSRRH
ncbi:MAG: DUF1707 domain-containing protein [Actinobacteria bacterium]|nr:DUF1707 domain-containing protein [Actinomycetota bacterium]